MLELEEPLDSSPNFCFSEEPAKAQKKESDAPNPRSFSSSEKSWRLWYQVSWYREWGIWFWTLCDLLEQTLPERGQTLEFAD